MIDRLRVENLRLGMISELERLAAAIKEGHFGVALGHLAGVKLRTYEVEYQLRKAIREEKKEDAVRSE